MVILKDVNRNGNIIMCKYYPNGGDEYGIISLNVDNMTVEIEESEVDKNSSFFINHVIRVLKKISDEKEFLEEYTVMWY